MKPQIQLTLPTAALALLCALSAPAMAQALPHNLQNGAPANADEVMANFTLVNQKAETAQAAAAALANALRLGSAGQVGIGLTPSVLDQRHAFPTIFGTGSDSGSFAVQLAPSLFQGTRLISQCEAPAGQGAQHRFRSSNLGNLDIGQDSSGNFVVQSDDATRMIVQRGGNVGIGTTAPDSKLRVEGEVKVAGAAGNLRFEDRAGGSNYQMFVAGSTFQLSHGGNASDFRMNGANISMGEGFAGGGIRLKVGVQGDGSRAESNNWAIFSDARLKKDVVTIEDALGIVTRLRGVRFNWIRSGVRDIGMIAQEVEAVIPEIVHTNEYSGYKSVSYERIVAVLVEAVQAQQEQITVLQRDRTEAIAAQQEQIADLHAANDALAARLVELQEAVQPLLAGKR